MDLLSFKQLSVGAQILATKKIQERIFSEASVIREMLTKSIMGSVESFGLPTSGLSLVSMSSSDFEASITGDVNLSKVISCNSKLFSNFPESVIEKMECGVVCVRISNVVAPGINGFASVAQFDITGLADKKEVHLLESAMKRIVDVAKIDAYARTAKNIIAICDEAGKVFDINGDIKLFQRNNIG